MQIVNVLQLRSKLGEILDKVYEEENHLIISRLNKPMVAMIPISHYYDHFSKQIELDKRKKANQLFEAWRKKYGQKVVGIDFTAEVRKLRDSR